MLLLLHDLALGRRARVRRRLDGELLQLELDGDGALRLRLLDGSAMRLEAVELGLERCLRCRALGLLGGEALLLLALELLLRLELRGDMVRARSAR